MGSFSDLGACITAERTAQVIFETFGHMEAEKGSSHQGSFVFIHGQHGDMVVVSSQFPSFEEGPGYFNYRQDFIWEKVKQGGPCEAIGIYEFDGFCKRLKNGTYRFVGKTKCLIKF